MTLDNFLFGLLLVYFVLWAIIVMYIEHLHQ